MKRPLDQHNHKMKVRADHAKIIVRDRRRSKIGIPVTGELGAPLPSTTKGTSGPKRLTNPDQGHKVGEP